MTPKEEQKHTGLLPCPFCGSDALLKNGSLWDDYGACRDAWTEIYCVNCPSVVIKDDPKEKAITAWNTRKADCHEELVVALRKFAIKNVHGIRHEILSTHCLLCTGAWSPGKPELHTDGCLARATNHQEG